MLFTTLHMENIPYNKAEQIPKTNNSKNKKIPRHSINQSEIKERH